MEHRHLGRSGLLISAITYGNWLTHGSQIDEDGARAWIHAAPDSGMIDPVVERDPSLIDTFPE
jgi:aryl-alcohol dehydrogenase-like predicted oxidoreductase